MARQQLPAQHTQAAKHLPRVTGKCGSLPSATGLWLLEWGAARWDFLQDLPSHPGIMESNYPRWICLCDTRPWKTPSLGTYSSQKRSVLFHLCSFYSFGGHFHLLNTVRLLCNAECFKPLALSLYANLAYQSTWHQQLRGWRIAFTNAAQLSECWPCPSLLCFIALLLTATPHPVLAIPSSVNLAAQQN